MSNLPRMRTIKRCYEYFKENDPEGCISEYYLRKIAKQKIVPTFKSGTKMLINLDKLIEYLNSEIVEQEPVLSGYGTIRRVGE